MMSEFKTTSPVTLAFTVFNEAVSLPRLLSSIEKQTLLPQEVVVVDAGSTDETVRLLRAWRKHVSFQVKIIVEHGANISKGRNLAIQAAKCDIIAVTDGGCELDSQWLERITKPLRQDNPADIVYGRTKAKGVTLIGKVFAAFYNAKTHVEEADGSEVSSRTVAFMKSTWQKAGGYPEWLSLAGEDTLFFLEVDTFANSVQAPGAVVLWYHGAESLAQIYKMHRRNSIGEGEANMWPWRHLVLCGVYGSIGIGLLSGLVYAPVVSIICGLLLVGFWSRQSLVTYRDFPKMSVILVLPVVLCVRDIGMLVGYFVGQKRRLVS